MLHLVRRVSRWMGDQYKRMYVVQLKNSLAVLLLLLNTTSHAFTLISEVAPILLLLVMQNVFDIVEYVLGGVLLLVMSHTGLLGAGIARSVGHSSFGVTQQVELVSARSRVVHFRVRVCRQHICVMLDARAPP